MKIDVLSLSEQVQSSPVTTHRRGPSSGLNQAHRHVEPPDTPRAVSHPGGPEGWTVRDGLVRHVDGGSRGTGAKGNLLGSSRQGPVKVRDGPAV